MDVTRDTRVMNVIADPAMRDVLAWYGLPINDRSFLRVTLEDFCAAHDVDVEDVLVELSVAESDDEEARDADYNEWMEPA